MPSSLVFAGLSRSHCALSALVLAFTVAACESGSGGSGGDGAGGGDGSSQCESYEGPCEPGDSYTCGTPPEVASGYCEVDEESCTTEWGTCWTPLVLSFDDGPVELRADSTHGFDLGGDASVVTDWPTARTPWLALDLDGDGSIVDGRELFGSMSILPGGARAANGFVALRQLDDNGDGRLTPDDPSFAKLLLWADRDGDRSSTPDELSPAAATLLSIDLAFVSEPRCDARGNCEIERARFRYRDASGGVRTGTVIDIHLRAQRR